MVAKKQYHNHFVAADLIRIVAIIFVVGIHIFAGTQAKPGEVSSLHWWIVNTFDGIGRSAVPLFVMLSGALLLDPTRPETVDTFFKKRFWRVGIPLIAWSLLYFFWRNWFEDPISIKKYLEETFADARPYHHMYYLFLISGLYLVTPILKVFYANASDRLKRYAITVGFALAAAGSFINMWFRGQWLFGSLLSVSFFVPYISYYLAGAYLREKNYGHSRAITAVYLTSVVSTVLGTYGLINRWGFTSRGILLHDYLSPNVIAMSLTAFIMLTAQFRLARLVHQNSLLHQFSHAAFGIYLIHPIILNLLLKTAVSDLPLPLMDALLLPVVLTISAFTVKVFSYTKPLKKIVGL